MTLRITSSRVAAEVVAAGGIIWRPAFTLADGRVVYPFADAPWTDDASQDGLEPPYLRRLGGAFLAVPFGGRAIPEQAGDWAPATGDAQMHGSANSVWATERTAHSQATLTLDGGADDSFSRIEQRVTCGETAATLEVEVVVTARRRTTISAGYHPILRLPERGGDLVIKTSFARGYTTPVICEAPVTEPAATFASLDQVPAAGGMSDLSKLPLQLPGEALVLLGRSSGILEATYLDEGYRLTITWDREVLPNCLLWLHDRAPAAWPGGAQFRGLGVEPSASALDLAQSVSAGDNPLKSAGERTALTIDPAAPTRFSVSFAMESA